VELQRKQSCGRGERQAAALRSPLSKIMIVKTNDMLEIDITQSVYRNQPSAPQNSGPLRSGSRTCHNPVGLEEFVEAGKLDFEVWRSPECDHASVVTRPWLQRCLTSKEKKELRTTS
jgi:hypothetical protein